MTRRPVLAAAAVALLAAVAPAADPPAEFRYIPPDAALFVYFDVAAVYDSKLGAILKDSQSFNTVTALGQVTKLTGGTPADLKALLFAVPKAQDQASFQKSLSVVTFRKKYDRDKVIAGLKAQAKLMKGEFAEKDNLVRVTTPSPFTPDDKLVTTHDLTDLNRIVSIQGLGDGYLKPGELKGVHADTLKQNPAAAVVAGVNFNALPPEIRGQELPPEERPFRPIVLADTLSAVGTIADGKLAVRATVKAKNKGDAAEVEKSFDVLRKLGDDALEMAKKGVTPDQPKAKELGEAFGAVQKALKDVKFTVDGTTTTASLSLPLDAPYAVLFERVFGSGGVGGMMQSQNNLKQLGIAMHNYESAYGHLPAPASLNKKGKKLLSWRVEILPYIEHEDLYKKFKLDEPWDSEHNLKVMKDNPMPLAFALPGSTDADDKKTHYQVFVGNGAMFEPAGPTRFQDVTDGLSNTALVVTAATAVEWTKPDDIDFDANTDLFKVLLFQNNRTQVALGDGSVRAIADIVSGKTLRAMVTRNGGEVLGDDF